MKERLWHKARGNRGRQGDGGAAGKAAGKRRHGNEFQGGYILIKLTAKELMKERTQIKTERISFDLSRW